MSTTFYFRTNLNDQYNVDPNRWNNGSIWASPDVIPYGIVASNNPGALLVMNQDLAQGLEVSAKNFIYLRGRTTQNESGLTFRVWYRNAGVGSWSPLYTASGSTVSSPQTVPANTNYLVTDPFIFTLPNADASVHWCYLALAGQLAADVGVPGEPVLTALLSTSANIQNIVYNNINLANRNTFYAPVSPSFHTGVAVSLATQGQPTALSYQIIYNNLAANTNLQVQSVTAATDGTTYSSSLMPVSGSGQTSLQQYGTYAPGITVWGTLYSFNTSSQPPGSSVSIQVFAQSGNINQPNQFPFPGGNAVDMNIPKSPIVTNYIDNIKANNADSLRQLYKLPDDDDLSNVKLVGLGGVNVTVG